MKARTRKPKPPPVRSLRWQKPLLAIKSGRKTNSYYLIETTDEKTEGRSFVFVKYADANGKVAKYNVLLDAKGHHSCECADMQWRGRHLCKHQLALIHLIAKGLL